MKNTNKTRDAVVIQRKEGGSHYTRNSCSVQKVDKGLSLQEASKSINISHKQILNWKKQAGTMKNKSNQQAKSLGDGVTPFSPHILTTCFLLFLR